MIKLCVNTGLTGFKPAAHVELKLSAEQKVTRACKLSR